MARAWVAVQRLYPPTVREQNPFRCIDPEHRKSTIEAAVRDEAYAFCRSPSQVGEAYLAAVPLIAIEWYQRSENDLAGDLIDRRKLLGST